MQLTPLAPRLRHQSHHVLAHPMAGWAPRPATPIRPLFGTNVFSDEVMKARLPENIYKAIRNTIKKGAPLDPAIADVLRRR